MKVGDLMPLISAFTFNISSILNVGRTIIDLNFVWYVIYLLIYDEAKICVQCNYLREFY